MHNNVWYETLLVQSLEQQDRVNSEFAYDLPFWWPLCLDKDALIAGVLPADWNETAMEQRCVETFSVGSTRFLIFREYLAVFANGQSRPMFKKDALLPGEKGFFQYYVLHLEKRVALRMNHCAFLKYFRPQAAYLRFPEKTTVWRADSISNPLGPRTTEFTAHRKSGGKHHHDDARSIR